MARSARQTSSQILDEITRKANFSINFNSKTGTNGAGNPVVSGSMNGGNMTLSLQDGSHVQINNVSPLDTFDHFVSGSASVPVSQTEANVDWQNC